MADSRKSRQQLSVGTVFYHRDFEGHSETKDRYFVVVMTDDTKFYCFTTTTSPRVINNPWFATEITPMIPANDSCLRKDCVIDCRELHGFDDIVMSNRLSNQRVIVKGTLSVRILRTLSATVRGTRTLDLDAESKEALCAQLDAACESDEDDLD